MPTIVLTCEVSAPIEHCFDLARSIDFHVRSLTHTGERAVAGVTQGLIGPGQEVTWRARHLALTWTLTSRITAFDRPHAFTDEQVRGPFASLRHVHRFEPANGSATRLHDDFTFQSPGGPLGRLAERCFLTAYMRGLLVRRNALLKSTLESGAWREFVPGPDNPD